MIIDGKKVAQDIQQEIKEFVNTCRGRQPCLAVILVGEDPPSKIYIRRKTQACEESGIRSIKIELPPETGEKKLLATIHSLNSDPKVDGILVQLPLPKHINPSAITSAIDPNKDVDGFHPINVGKMLLGESDGFLPCTPLGIRTLLERYEVKVRGQHAVIIGRSNIVGKPMSALLMQDNDAANATVTVTHRQTKNLKELCKIGDLIIVAIGKPKLVTADMIKEGAIVIDVGISQIPDKTAKGGFRIVGDVDFNNVKDKCSLITPVPGGVGPMTIAMLLQNTVQSYLRREGISSA
ncbi:MAG: bifunctional methylenetetrahydrofolate dehydrogenase/methenyltetrahydrofolate cyclohydrolase FolD [Waddliaceae bacterium]